MSVEIVCEELGPDSWKRVRDLRLASLEESPEMIGGDLQTENQFSEDQWRNKFTVSAYFVATIDGKDVGIVAVENLAHGSGDFGATCWVGGSWVHPKARGLGVTRKLFETIDRHGIERNWRVQGLGVFIENLQAISLYERLGFRAQGELQESTRKPGRYYQRMIKEI